MIMPLCLYILLIRYCTSSLFFGEEGMIPHGTSKYLILMLVNLVPVVVAICLFLAIGRDCSMAFQVSPLSQMVMPRCLHISRTRYCMSPLWENQGMASDAASKYLILVVNLVPVVVVVCLLLATINYMIQSTCLTEHIDKKYFLFSEFTSLVFVNTMYNRCFTIGSDFIQEKYVRFHLHCPSGLPFISFTRVKKDLRGMDFVM
mmetsp:Transcript_17659/g.23561  ORF Transcript_17659/g.23561 Transcript_17659/m.23561 type:complete len:203 (+) Transcript_17659:287-895(+)